MKPKKIAIVGAPNVGKSSIFNNLSGRYATVSNYPGTTVELFRAQCQIGENLCEIIDSPGMYSLLPLSEEERIARAIVLEEKPDLVIQVGTAVNLERTLALTLQLIEVGLPMILVLNIMDEAKKEGIEIDSKQLAAALGIAVVETVSVRNTGIAQLLRTIRLALSEQPKGLAERATSLVTYPEAIENAIGHIARQLKAEPGIFTRAAGLLALLPDEESARYLAAHYGYADRENLSRIRTAAQEQLSQPIEYVVNLTLQQKASTLIHAVVRQKRKRTKDLSRLLSDLTLKPLVGIPLLIFFLYFGLYKLVGEFGAGVCVDFLETKVFEGYVNPFFVGLFERFVHFEPLKSLFVGDYGIITLGMRYALAIILPIVGIFFLVFSFAEDTGYLPRLAALLDRLFKRIGLSGKAVIPMVLGLGCSTMATMVTRILPTKRERFIATFLLSLSVPCSAQLGVIMAVLSKRGWSLLIWFLTISSVFSFVGFLLNKVLKGRQPSFHIELPPLRLPQFGNILTKTYVRLRWYLKEVLPLFIWASVIIWIGQMTRLFDLLFFLLVRPLRLLGLPQEMASVFLFGFFRRDYGAAGLYDLEKQGLLSDRQIIVSAVVLTLFLPCIAQFLMNIKERGVKLALSIFLFILVFSFSVGVVMNKLLAVMGVN